MPTAHYVRDSVWQGGVTVAVYPSSQVSGGVASGAPVTTSAVGSDGTVVFYGLTPAAQYTAVGSGALVSFTAVDVEASLLMLLQFIETLNTVATSGAAQTLPDVAVATIHDVTLTANCTFTFPTPTAGKSFTVCLRQDGTGGRTVTWPASVKWASATAPVLTTTRAALDVFSFVCVNGTNWLGFVAGLDIR